MKREEAGREWRLSKENITSATNQVIKKRSYVADAISGYTRENGITSGVGNRLRGI
jgi:hypothetical protein